MRFFAHDDLPGLRIAAKALPGPWLIPPSLPPAHRERLVHLLASALGRGERTVHVIRLRWSECDLLRTRRLRVSDTSLVWWDLAGTPPPDLEAVLEESAYLTRGLVIYEPHTLPAGTPFEWLAPFKMETLYRVMDLFLDRRPVPDAAGVAESVRQVAAHVPSPIDLLEFADVLAERVALGESLEEARAEAAAHVAVSRFSASDEAGAADRVVEALAALQKRAPPDACAQALLERAGFLEGGRETPLVELLRIDGAMQRALTRVVVIRQPSRPLRDQAPECFPDDVTDEAPTGGAALQFHFDTEPTLPPPDPPPDEPARLAESLTAGSGLQEASQAAAAGKLEDAVRTVLDEIRKGRDADWRPSDAEMAARLLDAGARKLQERQLETRAQGWLQRVASLQEAAGKLFQRAGKPLAAARALCEGAETFAQALRTESATQLITLARRLADEAGDPSLKAATLLGLGRILSRQQPSGEAEKALVGALALYAEARDRLGEANTRKALGDLFRRTGRVYLAEQAYEEAFPVYYEIEDTLGEANTRKALGDVYRVTNRPREAEEAYVAALRAYRDIGDRLGEANIQKALGDLSRITDRLGEARKSYAEALASYRQLEDRLGEANALQSLGDLAARTRDLRAAKEAYDEALPIYRELESKLGEANTLRSIADVLAAQGADERRVIRMYYEAGKIHATVEDALGTGASLGMLARLFLRRGPAADALIAAEGSFRVLLGAGDAYGAALSLQAAMRAFALINDPYGRVLSAARLAAVASKIRPNAQAPLKKVLESLDAPTRAEAEKLLEDDVEAYRQETVLRAVLPRLQTAGLDEEALGQPLVILELLCGR